MDIISTILENLNLELIALVPGDKSVTTRLFEFSDELVRVFF